MTRADLAPDDILDFWFPDGQEPEPEVHIDHWVWRMRGGAHQSVDAFAHLKDLQKMKKGEA